MRNLCLLVLATIVLTFSCKMDKKSDNQKNPLLMEYNTPFEVPPFDKIKDEHFLPAIKEAIVINQEEIQKIINNPEPPTFENTLVAFDNCDIILDKITSVLYNLTSANINDFLQKTEEIVTPMITENKNKTLMNDSLFQRIKSVYNSKDSLSLNKEQIALLEKVYKKFVRGGANLNKEDKERLAEINKELSSLSIDFANNLREETNSFQLIIEDEKDLGGLPGTVIESAAEEAKTANLEGKWVFTLQKPSLIPFLQFSDKRELREKIFKAYINRCDKGNEYDNKEIIQKMIALRVEKAHLLGYSNYAEYILDDRMAKEPEKVYNLLDQLMEGALVLAKNEVADMQKIIDNEGGDFKLEPWDWWYYSEKVRKEKYDLNEELLRPYFQLEKVRDGMFMVAEKLYGIQFEERTDLPKYHEEVVTYEVKESDGSHIGILYMDFHPRPAKRVGAWMSSYRKQSRRKGKEVTPVITMVMNFTRPTSEKPALLNLDEVLTLFHEFGHALHGLLSDCNHHTVSGTSVMRDFVELPSQIMENWAIHPEVLKLYARHYETGEIIPDELITKLKNSQYFNKGFELIEYLAASYLDMDWHMLPEVPDEDVNTFEEISLEKAGLIPEIVSRYRSTYFLHIFKHNYAAGYYSYMWAEILDADAFNTFEEKGIFDKETAASFRSNILAKGGSDDPMQLYVNFKGKEPLINALLKRKGIN